MLSKLAGALDRYESAGSVDPSVILPTPRALTSRDTDVFVPFLRSLHVNKECTWGLTTHNSRTAHVLNIETDNTTVVNAINRE